MLSMLHRWHMQNNREYPGVSPNQSNTDPRTFACGGAGLLGFVVFLLLVAEQDSRYVEDKSDQIQV